MKKIVSLLVALLLLLTCLPVLGEDTVRIAALKGPTSMGMVQMMRDYSGDYSFTIAGAVDEISPLLLKGEIDIAALPANLGANLYQKTGGEIVVLCVNTLGVLYLVENGDTVHSVEDLKGKTIFASGKGATPEYALSYILQGNGLTDEVTVEYKSEHSECLAALISTPGSVALLPQPFVTSAQMQQEGIRMAIDLNEEWEKLGQGALLTGVLVARKSFVTEHPEELAAFMTRYAESVAFTNEQPAEAAALIEEYGILKAAVAEKAIPYCCIVCVEGEQMKESLSGYLQVLYAQNPNAVGGALPEEDFYYSR